MEEKKVIQYYSDDIQSIIDKYITEYRYGDFSEILADIFQRRAYEYGLTDEELKDDLKTFVKRVQKIQIVPKDFFDGKGASAWYLANNKKIEISDELFKEFSERFSGDKTRIGKEFYAVFAHEVYHAVSHKKDDEIGLSVRIPFQKNPANLVMNEAFTEVASSRTIYRRDEKHFDLCTNPVSGYNVVTFAPSLLANAIGVSEREILKAGMQGNKSLEEFMCSKFPENKKREVKNLLGKFELHLQAYYKILIDDKFAKTVRGKDLLKHQICEITKSVYGLNYLQMTNDKREITKELLDELSFRNGNISKILENCRQGALKLGILSEEDIDSIYKGVKLAGNVDLKSMDIINQYETYLFFKQKGVKGDALTTLESIVRSGTLRENSEELKNIHGIDISEHSAFYRKYWEENGGPYKIGGADLYKEKIKTEDYHEFLEWDNEEIFDKTLDVFENMRKKFNSRKVQVIGLRMFRKTMGAFKKLFNNKDALPEETSIYDEEDRGYKTDVSGLDNIKVEGIKYNPRLSNDNKSGKKDKQVEDNIK